MTFIGDIPTHAALPEWHPGITVIVPLVAMLLLLVWLGATLFRDARHREQARLIEHTEPAQDSGVADEAERWLGGQ